MKKLIFFIPIVLLTFNCVAQKCYIIRANSPFNRLFEVDIATCEITLIDDQCSEGIDDLGADIAMNDYENIYFITNYYSNNLYRKNLNSNEACELVIENMEHGGNSLVADDNFIYMAHTHLSIYDISTFELVYEASLGNLQSIGDLFFYENKLYMAGREIDNNSESSYTGIYEINLNNPSESCLYMSLEGIEINTVIDMFNTFSINYGTSSKTYCFGRLGTTTKLIEIDMVNQTLVDTGCEFYFTMPGKVLGAASVYDLTNVTETCGELNTNVVQANKTFFRIKNPVSERLEISTNIEEDNIRNIELYNILGQKIKTFNNSLNSLNVSDLTSGYYIIIIKLKNGKTIKQRLIFK
ncbi:T9SS type A sorting domain-containing protein [Flavobacterium salilacus subsp. salilacus]|uniref:T9SS type A sorting domain-containing protein n=1 Tax=Flavobacterium TaxID=237 RepID=UPI001074B49D|nr:MULTISPECIES: T9SS type A sorting domain-containing protein [Flavobacterium]KAF2518779.1 T9SS type A sorting domain-containing protein [Flavobacterium salilacus subsp. salilacus]MBE1613747.1 T9SS type A sorting domain-containing protein [Flavobacterium sp. SaA2.13]